jgi:hypothetical protein
MAELTPVALLPEPLARVQLRSIGRQARQVQALRRALGEEISADRTAMDRRAIPDNDQAAAHLAQAVCKNADDVVSVNGVILAAEVASAAGREGTDRRQLVTGVPRAYDRRLTSRGIGAHDAGQGLKARFSSEEERLLRGLRPVWRAGHVSPRQWAIAASSRCRARLVGLCGLQCRVSRKRPTCRGW